MCNIVRDFYTNILTIVNSNFSYISNRISRGLISKF